MKPFIFSADSHILEPGGLFLEGLPASLRAGAVHTTRDEKYQYTKSGDRVLHRMQIGDDGLGGTRRKRIGFGNLSGRLQDMAEDGVDAEICFPSLGLMVYFLEDRDLELATAEIYNNWNNHFLKDHLDRFVRCGVLPVRNLDDTLNELKRLASMGFTAAMLPVVTPAGVPAYNDARWDPIFAAGAEHGIVFVLHTGTGLTTFVGEKGPGAAVVNYTRQMNDGIDAIMLLVAGGVLDRNPGAKVAVIEAGASWLQGVCERMDEVYDAHQFYVRPKLQRRPSQIVRDQVACAFQHDRGCVLAREVTGHRALLFATDYPHMEGTFPHSQDVVARLFQGIDISEEEKTDILGGNALRLFRLPQPAILESPQVIAP